MSKDLVISVEEKLLAEATSRAASEQQTLDQLMRQWLKEYVERKNRVEHYRELMQRLSYVRAPGWGLTRDELNER
jgi:recombinational DNA repair protein (RecF pathway)